MSTGKPADTGGALPVQFIGPEPEDANDDPVSLRELVGWAATVLLLVTVCTAAMAAAIGFISRWVLP